MNTNINTTTTATFSKAAEAVRWLNRNSGLWAGLSTEDQEGCYELLEEEGFASVRTPFGHVFKAVISI